MKILSTNINTEAEIKEAISREHLLENDALSESVGAILKEVRNRGDSAVLEYTRQWDSPNIQGLEVTPEEFDEAQKQVSDELIGAMALAGQRIRDFHKAQLSKSWWMTTADKGIVGQMITPLQRVGAYAPGGKAVYPSTVLMNCIPAQVAGVPEIVLCVPPRKDGSAPPAVLAAALSAGVTSVYKVGGAQAIAAMAYGTETIPRVDKIVGPGNMYVTIAKRMVSGIVGIDMPAGPSEVCVIADETAEADFVAADMIVQVEHAEDCSAFCVTNNGPLAASIITELTSQIEKHPRKAIIESALEHSAIIITNSMEEAIYWGNVIAPEHLSLMVRDPWQWLNKVRNAGAVLLGHYSPQSLGDYAAGPSHTLPTGGAARFASPLNVDDFMKKTSVISYDPASLAYAAPIIEALAEEEGFDAHAYAVRVRMAQQGGA